MIEALYIGSTGMAAQQTGLETIANNLANMNTPTFKRARVTFSDLVHRDRDLSRPGGAGGYIGSGTRVGTIDTVFGQGDLRSTDSAFDVAIDGVGLIEVLLADGSAAFSRGGALQVNADGLLALGNGLPLQPPITIPPGAEAFRIERDGTVSVRLAGEATPVEVGRIELALFNGMAALRPLGENLHVATPQSGEPWFARPGEDGRGMLAQRFLEGANVRMADELVSLMLAQRAFEANARIIQAADDVLAMTNNLRRG